MGDRDDFEGWARDAAGPLFRHALMLTADRHLAELDDAGVEWLEWLLANHDDIDLYNWITGREPVPEKLRHPVMTALVNFKFPV